MLEINTELPFIYIVFCIILGLAYAYFLYNKEKGISPNKLIWTLFIFRSLLISTLVFLLMEPIIKTYVNVIEQPIVIIVKDHSESIKERVDPELKVLEDDLQDFDVHKYSFSDKVVEGIVQDNDGLKTNYSNLFYELNNKYQNRNVSAIVFASDGCYNTGVNPEFISYDFPVYPIALGDTNIYKDISIDNVLINEISFLGNSFPLEVSLASKLVNSAESRLTIWNQSKKVHDQIIKFSDIDDYKSVVVQLTAENIGLQTYTIKLEGLQGEKNLSNNMFKAYIDIIDSRYNILILKGGNHPDISAYKSVLDKNQNYNVDVKDVNEGIMLDKYQLVVLFSLDKIPSDLVKSDLPLIIFNSKKDHYSVMETSLNFIIKGGMEDIAVAMHDDFRKFTFSPNLSLLISSAPPLSSLFGEYRNTGAVDYILHQRVGSYISNNPVIFLEESNARKIAFITAEGWWRWKLFDFSTNQNNEAFDELFSKLSQYLLLQEDKSRFRIDYAKKIDENSDIIMRASLYNDSYELVNDKELELRIYDVNNHEYIFQFTKKGDQYIVNAGILESGAYNFIVKAKNSDFIKKGIFDVKKLQLEKISLVANHQNLKKIALISGGKLFYQNNIEGLVNTLNKSERNKKLIHTTEKLDSLINIPSILLILLVLISVEWITRRYNGLV
ncbi:MAG: hypothetical protein CMD16_03650 [Flavobacteriales bacterium]|nr:hypothetical protein [Flavobacteriales bacterium]|tara:strand:- start:33 stop:2036 length:2004 start_codon:yes stop_codon:yes gene_type:complete